MASQQTVEIPPSTLIFFPPGEEQFIEPAEKKIDRHIAEMEHSIRNDPQVVSNKIDEDQTNLRLLHSKGSNVMYFGYSKTPKGGEIGLLEIPNLKHWQCDISCWTSLKSDAFGNDYYRVPLDMMSSERIIHMLAYIEENSGEKIFNPLKWEEPDAAAKLKYPKLTPQYVLYLKTKDSRFRSDIFRARAFFKFTFSLVLLTCPLTSQVFYPNFMITKMTAYQRDPNAPSVRDQKDAVKEAPKSI